jgi:flavorubredoxin
MDNIQNNICWVGVRDPGLVTFDIVMETKYGTTYNSYLVNAEKKVIIDTVKENFKNDFISQIRKVIDPSEIDYIICNHTEPDHSGSLWHLLSLATNATVVGSGQALAYLQEMSAISFRSLKVKDGDTLDLGNKTLEFIGAPNLHWPDSIYTYLKDDRLLFTCDSFGAHYCSDSIFDAEAGDYADAYKYYFDVILRPFSKFILKAIEKIETMEIDMICPGHGPVLKSTWKEKVSLAKEFASEYMQVISGSDNYILITYISAYGYTREMANCIAGGIRSMGFMNIDLVDIEFEPLSELGEKIARASGILIGSPTINHNTLLPVYKMFALINPMRDKGKAAASFGSYGWSGEAVSIIDNTLRSLKLNVIQDGLAIRFFPDEQQIKQLVDFGQKFGKSLRKISSDEIIG